MYERRKNSTEIAMADTEYEALLIVGGCSVMCAAAHKIKAKSIHFLQCEADFENIELGGTLSGMGKNI